MERGRGCRESNKREECKNNVDTYCKLSMRFKSNSTCINFWNQLNFLMTMDYSPCSLAVFESSDISETGETTPTKIGVHACYINAYVHKIFGSIPID